jgi:hypothetical protein
MTDGNRQNIYVNEYYIKYQKALAVVYKIYIDGYNITKISAILARCSSVTMAVPCVKHTPSKQDIQPQTVYTRDGAPLECLLNEPRATFVLENVPRDSADRASSDA